MRWGHWVFLLFILLLGVSLSKSIRGVLTFLPEW